MSSIKTDLETIRDDLLDLLVVHPEITEEAQTKLWDSFTQLQESIQILDVDYLSGDLDKFLFPLTQSNRCIFHRRQAD